MYPVRLGKFRATNVVGETSNSNFDAIRCYSMGSYEYVVGNSDLRVAFVPKLGNRVDKDKRNGSIHGKKISNRSKDAFYRR